MSVDYKSINPLYHNQEIDNFRATIWNFYRNHGRSFAWRHTKDPYRIVISEVMLQQTQTYRVIEKYEQFIAELPTFQALAQASLLDVLGLWQGLGYNRRGKYLHELAKKVTADFDGVLPADPALLVTLPGVGPATAASISAFAFNTPTVFIETNVRTVFIHHFFKDRSDIHDKEIVPLVAAALDRDNPREWYYALMDYGVMLKATLPNPSRKSAHHARQSKFEGSDRQIRGAIIRALTEKRSMRIAELAALIDDKKGRFERILQGLERDQMVRIDSEQKVFI
jgi:A/G-specific adenine glycosylase